MKLLLMLFMTLWSVLPEPIKDDPYSYGLSYEIFVQLNESDFDYMAQVIEAESDRASGCTTGKIHVSACIWDRVFSKSFKNSVRGVLDEPGQFTTTSNGSCWMPSTDGSRRAVVEGLYAVWNRDIPANLFYFNCVGYNCGTAYDYIEGIIS